MGRTGVPPNITRAECERVLDIIQKDYELRRKEHEQLSKIQEEVNEHAAQRDVLSKRKEFNEKYCILCCSAFNLLFRRRIQCEDCHFQVCRTCAAWENHSKVWICIVCEKQRFIDAESNAWFYNRIKQRFKLFGAAKVLETHCRKRRTSDSENDSGYGHPSDFKPLLNLFSCSSSHSISSMAETSALDEDDVDDEDAEIHQSVESIVEGLLGCSLDDASVDHMYTHNLYDQIFYSYHSRLVVAVRNLTLALQRSRCHLSPAENECSPTVAHASLKLLISDIVQECQNLPDLQLSDCNGWRDHTENFKIKDSDIFSSYDSLVAAAIINKIVEEAQMKYVRPRRSLSQESSDSTKDKETSSVSSSSEKPRSSNLGETLEISADEDFTYIKIPVECVQVEEIEEVTREYTDSEDDKFSSISHQSSGRQSTDDLGLFREDSEISFPGISEMPDDGKIPFPEFGRDLVDDVGSLEDITICHPTAVTSWEENWLFRKKKRLPLYSNLKYQLLTYCDEPPYMLIPCPSESDQLEDSLEHEDLSELSESHSVGSLEFSSESGDSKTEQIPSSEQTERVEYHMTESDEDSRFPHSDVSIMYQDSGISDLPEPDLYRPNARSMSHKTLQTEHEVQFKEANLYEETSSIEQDMPSSMERVLPQPTHDHLFDVPTLPGSIAEREHQKWRNAAPLKNNPYSAENISKRLGKPPKSLVRDHASFEEFEKELLDSSDILSKQTDENKLDCGLKTIDVNLYKRDYYVNNSKTNGFCCENAQEETLSSMELLNDMNHDSIPDEALNSLEEKVYISSGKVFTLENHFKRLERELKDISLSSNDLSSLPSSLLLNTYQPSQIREDIKNRTVESTSEDERPTASLPSVKSLATKFNPATVSSRYIKHSESKKSNINAEKLEASLQTRMEDNEKVKRGKPCMKVHSLTARSLSREFRVMARQNLPRPMNRTVSVKPQNSEDISERDCISPASVPSPVCGSGISATPDLAHGYTSDESSTSTNSLPRPKARRHISRAILQRASYWERRAEQGLLSDASVNEEFPAIDINPD